MADPNRALFESVVDLLVYFVATKLEAFHGRGGGDVTASHDLEDILTVVDGRPELVSEIGAAEPEVRAFIAAKIRTLLPAPDFVGSGLSPARCRKLGAASATGGPTSGDRRMTVTCRTPRLT